MTAPDPLMIGGFPLGATSSQIDAAEESVKISLGRLPCALPAEVKRSRFSFILGIFLVGAGGSAERWLDHP